MDVKNDIFRSDIGSGFGERGGRPPIRTSRSNPPAQRDLLSPLYLQKKQ